jgi:hypothetical protein
MNYAVMAGRAREEPSMQSASNLAIRRSGDERVIALSPVSRMERRHEKGNVEKTRSPVTSSTPPMGRHV